MFQEGQRQNLEAIGTILLREIGMHYLHYLQY